MEGLNFIISAISGPSLAKAVSAKPRNPCTSISAQIRLLEEALGDKLFQRSGRHLVLTETGKLVMSYADEIFSTGRELMNTVRLGPGTRELRLNVGVTDSVSKLIA